MIAENEINYPVDRPESWTKSIIRRIREVPRWRYPWVVLRPVFITVDGPTSHAHRFGTFDEALEWAEEHPANPVDMREWFTDSHKAEKGMS